MTHIKLIIVLGLCLALVTFASAQEAQWKELNQRVQTLNQEGKYEEGPGSPSRLWR